MGGSVCVLTAFLRDNRSASPRVGWAWKIIAHRLTPADYGKGRNNPAQSLWVLGFTGFNPTCV
jgi:hypothetical protein